MTTQTQYFITEPSFGCPFHTEAIRFLPTNSHDDGLTLIFLHASNLHKETWQPLVLELLQDTSGLRIKDIWVIDNPNHGRSATLNRALLSSDEYKEHWTAMYNTKAIYAFLATRTHGVDFRKRKLVLVSQSGGSITSLLLYKMHPELRFQAFVFMDPAVLPKSHPNASLVGPHFKKIALIKNDLWANKDEARQDLLNKGGFRYFRSDAFELYLECALRPIGQQGAVTLACTKIHDFSYHESDENAGEILLTVCKEDNLPIHLIACAKDEFKNVMNGARPFHKELIGGTSHGSVQVVEKGGHLFPQVAPALAAHCLREALSKVDLQKSRL